MKLLLVDDHALFRDGLALLIDQAGLPAQHLLHAGDLAEARARLAEHPDIRLVLLDLALPDSDGLDTLRRLREPGGAPACLVVSAQDDARTVLAAIDAGAVGFIPKSAQSELMLDALRTVLAGGVYLPTSVSARPPARAAAAMVDAAEQLGLSPRQVDVLRLLIEGRANKQICSELGLAESTVKTHLEAIFKRLDVNSRTQAVVAAARLGLRLGGALERA